ncbi:hypothetical protein [Streptosporangium sp. KLBMP 9127]|nr:hypothetical protein [Streptosporangium sp. KLBMP 9127]
MSHRRTLVTAAVALTLLATAQPAVAAPAGSAAPLSSGLLTRADLPAGYSRFTPSYQKYQSSTAPTCSSTLDGLEFSKPRRRGVQYATVAYAKGETGPWVMETLRSYRSGSAKKAFDQAVAKLRKCRDFEQTYTRPKPRRTVAVSVRGVRFPAVATQTWAAGIAVAEGSLVLTNVLVLARHKNKIMILSQLGYEAPDAGTLTAIARRAAAKMRATG